ncbi:DEAD/DEAH box helicase [Paenibacillaceae bacterium]|nr:DEAD/DEAH box helicase [Paenibacillaceae bacterium]
MTGAKSNLTWLIDGHWLEGEGLWISAVGWNGTWQRLKNMLFAWHEGSWFGTEVTDKTVDGRPGLLVGALHAMDYLSKPKPVSFIQIEWSVRMQAYMAEAGLIREAMIEGRFVPDLSGWRSGGGGQWKRLIDPEEARSTGEPGVAAVQLTDAIRNDWLSMAVSDAIAMGDGSFEAFEKLWSSHSMKAGPIGTEDEEDWLISIGWKQDNTPYRVLLQLVEPMKGEQEGWRLRIVIQDREQPAGRIGIRYATSGYEADDESEIVPELWRQTLDERIAKEQRKWLQVFPERGDPDDGGRLRMDLSEEEAWAFLEQDSIRLLQSGCSVLLPGWWEAVRRRKVRWKAKVKSSVGSAAEPMFGLDQIVNFDWKLAIGNLDLTEEEFSRIAAENKRLIRMNEEWIHLDPADLQELKSFIGARKKQRGMSFRDILAMVLRGEQPASEMDEAEEHSLGTEIELNDHLQNWLEQLESISRLPMVGKPADFIGELRPYQLQGVSWLVFLRRFGLGGCLADDMGLGKTIQFTAYLLHIKALQAATGSDGYEQRPSLLICPTSVLGNWEKELNRFAPSLRVALHYGPRRSKGDSFADSLHGIDLVITSYPLAALDEDDLCTVEWNCLCLDEAQNIKNVYTKQSAAIRNIPSFHRIALTGTPMENRMTELWSIYDFLNPGYLGTLLQFRREVVQPIEKTRDEALIRQLQRVVKPFMLRRLKKDPDIQLSLPEKNELKTYISLTAEQGGLYENIVSGLLEQLDTLSPMQRRGLILASLTKLKQLCNHPALLLGAQERNQQEWQLARSNKLVRLMEMVEEIAAEGERCLIFTQFVGMGRVIQRMIQEKLGMTVPYLHGGVDKAGRDNMIEEFQDQGLERCAFVLSLKAGGTGLNLTAANHVIHFDRWWNPAVENQATDRSFRIGQTKNVQVYKFVTLGTLEEKIDEMIDRKQSLNDQVVGQSESWITELSGDELAELFTLRKTWLQGDE